MRVGHYSICVCHTILVTLVNSQNVLDVTVANIDLFWGTEPKYDITFNWLYFSKICCGFQVIHFALLLVLSGIERQSGNH